MNEILFSAPERTMRTQFPDISRSLGNFVFGNKTLRMLTTTKHRGLELHNNESSITRGGQGHWRSEISFPFRQQARKMS